MSETKTKNLCTVPAADLTDSQYFIAEDGGELKRIPKVQVVLKKLENMLATDTENLAGGGEVTAQELLDALAEQVANKLLAKSQVVNNLLATVEGNPLDATQGKALKELIDTTNNNLSNVQNRFYKKTDKTDFNDLTTNGYYYGVLTSNTPDGTTTENWVVEVQTFDNNPLYVFQRVTRVSDKRIFTRHREGKTIGWKNWEILATKSDLNNIVTSENIKSISFTAGEIKTLTVKTNCNDYVPCIVKERTNGKPLVVANFWSETSDVSKIILYAPLLTTNANIDIYFIKRDW